MGVMWNIFIIIEKSRPWRENWRVLKLAQYPRYFAFTNTMHRIYDKAWISLYMFPETGHISRQVGRGGGSRLFQIGLDGRGLFYFL